MTRTLALALLFVAPAVAAPLPDAERERLAVARTFGTWTDPTREHAFRTDGPFLRVRLPGALYGCGLPAPPLRSVPRFARRVEGDFTAVVRVDCPPRTDEAVADYRRLAGGLVAVDASGAHAMVWRGESALGGARCDFGTYQTGPRERGVYWSSQERIDRVWIRLTRIGGSVRFGCGPDEKAVKECTPEPMDWSGPVDVGVFAENTTGVRAEVTFDQFTLTRLKAKEAAP